MRSLAAPQGQTFRRWRVRPFGMSGDRLRGPEPGLYLALGHPPNDRVPTDAEPQSDLGLAQALGHVQSAEHLIDGLAQAGLDDLLVPRLHKGLAHVR